MKAARKHEVRASKILLWCSACSLVANLQHMSAIVKEMPLRNSHDYD
jgi:hypothetical protein